MEETFTIDGVTIRFLQSASSNDTSSESWSAIATIANGRQNLYYSANKISFAPLRITTAHRLKTMLEMPAELHRSDEFLLLEFRVEILEQKVTIRFYRDLFVENAALSVALQEQKEITARLIERVEEIDPKALYMNVAVWLRPAGLSFEPDHVADVEHVDRYRDLWWQLVKDRFCSRRADISLYEGYSMKRTSTDTIRIGDAFSDAADIMQWQNCMFEKDGAIGMISTVRIIPAALTCMYRMKYTDAITHHMSKVQAEGSQLQINYDNKQHRMKARVLGFIQMLRVPLPHRIVATVGEAEDIQKEEIENRTVNGCPAMMCWNSKNKVAVVFRPVLT